MAEKGVIYILTNPSFPQYVKIGYADNVESRLKQLNNSECIVPKSALVEFLVGDFAFEIVHKSTWHMNTILLFVEKE